MPLVWPRQATCIVKCEELTVDHLAGIDLPLRPCPTPSGGISTEVLGLLLLYTSGVQVNGLHRKLQIAQANRAWYCISGELLI